MYTYVNVRIKYVINLGLEQNETLQIQILTMDEDVIHISRAKYLANSPFKGRTIAT